MTDATGHAASTRHAAAASFFGRVLAIMGGWTALHLLVVAALAHGVVPGGWWTFLALYAFILAALVFTLRGFFVPGTYPGKLARLFVARPFWYSQILLFPLSVAGALGWLLGLPFGAAVASGRASMSLVGTVWVVFLVAGYFGSRRLVVRRLTFEFPDLPRDFDGVTVAQLSDLHVGPHTSAGFLRRVARAVEAAKPDVIAFTGDQVDDYARDVERFAAVFGPLRAPLGAFAIAGNHDVYAGWRSVRAGMESAGMRVLVNAAVPIRRGASELWIAGTGDPAGHASFGPDSSEVAPDLAKTLSAVPSGAFCVALAHNPALWPDLARSGVQLTLSGHTHHGQLSVPFLNWCLASPFLELAMGTHARNGSRLYISPGTNYWAIPLRIGAWPEVTIVTLKKRAPQRERPPG